MQLKVGQCTNGMQYNSTQVRCAFGSICDQGLDVADKSYVAEPKAPRAYKVRNFRKTTVLYRPLRYRTGNFTSEHKFNGMLQKCQCQCHKLPEIPLPISWPIGKTRNHSERALRGTEAAMNLEQMLQHLNAVDLPTSNAPTLLPINAEHKAGSMNDLITFWVNRVKTRVEELDRVYLYANEFKRNSRNSHMTERAEATMEDTIGEELCPAQGEVENSGSKSEIYVEPDKAGQDGKRGSCLSIFEACNVVIVGLDGIGATLAQKFASIGVRRLVVVDDKVVRKEDTRGLFYSIIHVGLDRTKCVVDKAARVQRNCELESFSTLQSLDSLNLEEDYPTILISNACARIPRLGGSEDLSKRLVLVDPCQVAESCGILFKDGSLEDVESMALIPFQSCCVGCAMSHVERILKSQKEGCGGETPNPDTTSQRF